LLAQMNGQGVQVREGCCAHASTSSGGWEKLLHQPFLVGLEGFELLGFGGDQGVEAAQARSDAL
jgi:hypothetical protein